MTSVGPLGDFSVDGFGNCVVGDFGDCAIAEEDGGPGLLSRCKTVMSGIS